jgi:hypothetical protein
MIQLPKSNREPVELMVTHPFPEEPEVSNEDTATEVVEAPPFQIQHCSLVSS